MPAHLKGGKQEWNGASAGVGEGSASQFLLPTTLNVDANFIKINFFYDVSSSFSFYLRRVRKKITAKHFCPLAVPPVPLPRFPLHFPSLCHVLPVGFWPVLLPVSTYPFLPAHFSIFPHHRHSGFYGRRGFYGSAIGSFPSDGRTERPKGSGGSLPTASNLNTYSGAGDGDGERDPFTRGSSPFVDNARRSLLLLNVFRTPKVLAHKNLDELPQQSTALHCTHHTSPHTKFTFDIRIVFTASRTRPG